MSDPPALSTVFDHFGVDYRERLGNQQILCFVHEETRPSCTVDLAKGVFNCKACDAQGGVYDAVMALAKLEDRRAAADYCTTHGLGTSDEPVRGKHRERPSIPGGSRFRPKYQNRSAPPWRRAE